MNARYGRSGWHGESTRHYLAAKYGSAPKRYMAADRTALIRTLMRAEGLSEYEAEYAADEALKKSRPMTTIVNLEKNKIEQLQEESELANKFSRWKSRQGKVAPVTQMDVATTDSTDSADSVGSIKILNDPSRNIRLKFTSPDPDYIHIHPDVLQEEREKLGEKFILGYSPPSLKEKVYALQRKLGLPQSDKITSDEVLGVLKGKTQDQILTTLDDLQVAAPQIAADIKKQLASRNYTVVLNPVTGEKEYRLTSQQPTVDAKGIVTYSTDYSGQAALEEYRRTYSQLEALRNSSYYGAFGADGGGAKLKTALELKLKRLENNLKIAGKDVGAFADSFKTQFPKTAAFGKEAGRVAEITAQAAARKAKQLALEQKREFEQVKGEIKHEFAEPYVSFQLKRDYAESQKINKLQEQLQNRVKNLADMNEVEAYDEVRKLLKLKANIAEREKQLTSKGSKLVGFAESEGIPFRERVKAIEALRDQQITKARVEAQQKAYDESIRRQENLVAGLSPQLQSVLRRRGMISPEVRTISPVTTPGLVSPAAPEPSSLMSALAVARSRGLQ